MIEFSRKIDIEKQLRAQNGDVFIEATEDERKALQERFGFLDILNLSLRGRISQKQGRGYLFKGAVQASFIQACTETEKPLSEEIDEPIEVFLVYKLNENEDDYTHDEEKIENGCVDFGEIASQYLSLSSTSYPLCKAF
jgi:hypothetical protein